MALRNQPYIPLYVQDYLTDEKLNMCSWETQGIYVKIMCIMHKSEIYGSILLKQKDKQDKNICLNFAKKISKLFPISTPILEKAIIELIEENVLQLDKENLILSQKRMIKDNDISIKRSKAGSKGGTKTQFVKAKVKAKSKANSESESEDENKKHKYGSYKNVLLKDKELEKLKEKFGDKYIDQIEMLSEGLELKNYNYKSHYLAILKWSKNSKIDVERKSEVKLTHNEVLILFNGKFNVPADPDVWEKLKSVKELDKTYWVYK